jgi:hypothetical protein
MGLGGLLEFFCNSMTFSAFFYCRIAKNKLNLKIFLKKKKMVSLEGLVFDFGKNCVAHDAVDAVFATLF